MSWRVSAFVACLAVCGLGIAAQSPPPTERSTVVNPHDHDRCMHDVWIRGQSVFAIGIAPQAHDTHYFTSDSLRRILPHLYPAHIRSDWCKDKDMQRGVVVFSNGDVVFWHSCAPKRIFFEGTDYPGTFGFTDNITGRCSVGAEG